MGKTLIFLFSILSFIFVLPALASYLPSSPVTIESDCVEGGKKGNQVVRVLQTYPNEILVHSVYKVGNRSIDEFAAYTDLGWLSSYKTFRFREGVIQYFKYGPSLNFRNLKQKTTFVGEKYIASMLPSNHRLKISVEKMEKKRKILPKFGNQLIEGYSVIDTFVHPVTKAKSVIQNLIEYSPTFKTAMNFKEINSLTKKVNYECKTKSITQGIDEKEKQILSYKHSGGGKNINLSGFPKHKFLYYTCSENGSKKTTTYTTSLETKSGKLFSSTYLGKKLLDQRSYSNEVLRISKHYASIMIPPGGHAQTKVIYDSQPGASISTANPRYIVSSIKNLGDQRLIARIAYLGEQKMKSIFGERNLHKFHTLWQDSRMSQNLISYYDPTAKAIVRMDSSYFLVGNSSGAKSNCVLSSVK